MSHRVRGNAEWLRRANFLSLVELDAKADGVTVTEKCHFNLLLFRRMVTSLRCDEMTNRLCLHLQVEQMFGFLPSDGSSDGTDQNHNATLQQSRPSKFEVSDLLLSFLYGLFETLQRVKKLVNTAVFSEGGLFYKGWR